MTQRPQTLHGVVGFMLFAILVWVAGPVVIDSRPFEWARAHEGMLTGASFAVIMTAIDYGRLPPEHRLAAPHAIGLGAFGLALISWMVTTGRRPLDLVQMIGLILMASPGLYLVVSGIRVLRRRGGDT